MCRKSSLVNLAIKVAQGSEHETRLGAIIARGSRVISIGWNKYKTHPRQTTYEKRGKIVKSNSIHAELDAIIKTNSEQLEGATIVVARILKNGTPGIAKPCPACRHVIRAAGIKRIIWTKNSRKSEIEFEED